MKKETKIVIACVGTAVVGAIIGAWLMKNHINSNLIGKEIELNNTINDAKNALRDISIKLNSTVQKVYESEAKKVFESRLHSITDADIADYAAEAIEDEAHDIVQAAVDSFNIKEAVKGYIEDNSLYFDRQIMRGINDIFDHEFIDDVQDAIKEKIKEA